MILALNTSQPTAAITLIGPDKKMYETYTWEAHRSLARDLLSKIQIQLSKHDVGLSDIEAIIYFKGPGSFTGLRIGAAVVNTIAHTNKIPIIGQTGDRWLEEGLVQLEAGKDDRVIIPEYGREANITKPRK